ncbi:glutathione S-transferase family protein [Polaromonas jejuensis]|uniref:Glutathione S-transferase family protein n=1 Tax=Polaromonas jejuensis TaxID=457502 RepID=A0ABW0QAM3_9BURK|nr:glutathione S-transferase family protein [Polaromonas jejuensis]
MRLYDTQRSGNAWKVRLLASLLNIRLERVTLSIDAGDLGSAAFRRVNPLAQVPTLELNDGRTIYESQAILHYLAHRTSLWPEDRFGQSQVLTWLSFEQSQHMHPLAQLRLRLALHRSADASAPEMLALRAQALKALTQLDARLSAQAAANGPDAWVAGTSISIADVALYPYTRLAPMGGIDLSAFPSICAWLERIEAHPGYEPLIPGQPDLNYTTKENSK